MIRHYTLKNGRTIRCWYNDLGYFTVYTDDNSGKEEYTLEFDFHDEDPTVVYYGETIHINEFNYMPLEELIEKVEEGIRINDRWVARHEDALATLMKESDRIGFVMEVECFNTIIPGLGIGLKGSGSPKVECLMVPFEDRWNKKDWHYKVELRPDNENLRPMVGRETLYFSDLWDSVTRGVWIKLVDREKWRAEHPDDKVTEEAPIHVFPMPI